MATLKSPTALSRGCSPEPYCNVCHMGDKPFMHPVNLGDISRFECSQRHSGQGVRVKDR
ncbi:MAG TPA: hypothetical protein VK421_02990 [Pyrinomonadaceae bacterium]|nr:hypothetical protein [Pyrinomonadaceae bacterium]